MNAPILCPYCGNTGLTVDDLELSGTRFKGIRCFNCNCLIGTFQDNNQKQDEIIDKIDDLERTIRDIENSVDRLSKL